MDNMNAGLRPKPAYNSEIMEIASSKNRKTTYKQKPPLNIATGLSGILSSTITIGLIYATN